MQRRAEVLTNCCLCQLLLPASNIRSGVLCQQLLFSPLGNPKKQSTDAKKRRLACFPPLAHLELPVDALRMEDGIICRTERLNSHFPPVRMFLQMYRASNPNILLNPAVFNDPPEEVGSGLS